MAAYINQFPPKLNTGDTVRLDPTNGSGWLGDGTYQLSQRIKARITVTAWYGQRTANTQDWTMGGKAIFEMMLGPASLYVYVGEYGAHPMAGGNAGPAQLSVDGETVAFVKGGTKSANGSVTVAPADAIRTVGSFEPNIGYRVGVYIDVLSANEPPTAPGSITYGTPYAAKPLDLIITPASDPD